MVPLIVRNLNHSIDYNWSGPTVKGEERITALDNLHMERQCVLLNSRVITQLNANTSEAQQSEVN